MVLIDWKVIVGSSTPLILAFAASVALAHPRTVEAHPTPAECSPSLPEDNLPVLVDNPDIDDERAIMNLIDALNWALDEARASPFTILLSPDVNYEVCMSGGTAGVFSASDRIAAIDYIDSLFDQLSLKKLRTRHFHSNMQLHVIDRVDGAADGEYSTVVGKITLLVTLQPAHREIPELDYTATVNATFVRDGEGWAVRRWKTSTDTPTPEEIGARAR